MTQQQPTQVSRRGFLRTLFTIPVGYLLAACGLRATAGPTFAPTSAALAIEQPTQPPPVPTDASTQPLPTEAPATEPPPTQIAQVLAPTPACGDDDDVTPQQTEGPFYTPNNPERTSFLEPGMTGAKMIVTGYVLTTACQPVAGALIDFWHCDDAGVYDNVGYKLRGHQFANDQGQYSLETIMPGIYTGRTRHFHVKVQAPNQPVLTTQLYFPDEPGNNNDGIFNSALLMDVQDSADGKVGAFNFVLAVG
jgi:protocatechuate 3,4-dioxygenase beta subunit